MAKPARSEQIKLATAQKLLKTKGSPGMFKNSEDVRSA